MPPEAEEREASDYERFSWRGSFESALMAADSRTKLSLLACSNDVGASAMATKRRSAGDLLFNPKSFSREQLDRVRSCGSIGGNVGAGTGVTCSGSIEEKIWSNRRRSSVPDANTRGESGERLLCYP
jgi:synaptotagmin-like protein